MQWRSCCFPGCARRVERCDFCGVLSWVLSKLVRLGIVVGVRWVGNFKAGSLRWDWMILFCSSDSCCMSSSWLSWWCLRACCCNDPLCSSFCFACVAIARACWSWRGWSSAWRALWIRWRLEHSCFWGRFLVLSDHALASRTAVADRSWDFWVSFLVNSICSCLFSSRWCSSSVPCC